MANVMQFALGLAPGNFLSTAVLAKVATAGLAAAATGIVVAGMMQAINRGDELVTLSNRTRESIASLVQLQHAFKQGGAEAGAVGPVINALQRSLSGTNEQGEKTGTIFAGTGTSIEELRGMSSTDALQKIFAGLRGLDANSAAGAAGKIFGRGMSASILTLSNDTEGFNQSLGEAEKTAALFAKHAVAFDRLGDTFEKIKLKAQGFFAGLAGGVTPAMQGISDALASIDLEGLGERAGKVFLGMGEAIRQQRLGELIDLSIQAGVQGGINFLIEKIKEIPAALGGAVREGLTSDTAGARRSRRVLASLDPTGILRSVTGAQDITRTLIKPTVLGVAGAKNEAKGRLDALMAELQAEAEKRAKVGVTTPAPAGQKTLDLTQKEDEKKAAAVAAVAAGGAAAPRIDSDALQRIGFFSRDRSSDPAHETARQTRLSSQLLFKINERLERFDGLGDNFANV